MHGRLPGLKFMRTWVCNVSGGPSSSRPPSPAKRTCAFPHAEFDEVAAELGPSLDFAKVPKREKAEVLVADHKDEVTPAASRPPSHAEAYGV